MSRLVQCIVHVRDWCNANSSRLPWCAALIGTAVLLPSVWGGFSMDDHYFHIVMDGVPGEPSLKCSPMDIFAFSDGDPVHNSLRMEHGIPWLAPARWQVAFFRPFTAFTHWADWKVFGNTAWPMHLHSLLLYTALVFAVTRLYQRIGETRGAKCAVPVSQPSTFSLQPWVAGLAGLFFAIDMSHGLTAGWIANRNAVLSALFVVLTVYFHDRWRRDVWRPGMVLACFALALGHLSGEAAVAAGGYLFAYALFLEPGTSSISIRNGFALSLRALLRRLVPLLPYLVVVGLWQIPYKALGYGVVSSRLYTD
ncbi:MAG: hypothetical protein NTU83_08800, partial [Candidatus Hydrogenedentes bacterium]|nr:hypothetical protein [Candidatus Hydrogenedentota bacterium]